MQLPLGDRRPITRSQSLCHCVTSAPSVSRTLTAHCHTHRHGALRTVVCCSARAASAEQQPNGTLYIADNGCSTVTAARHRKSAFDSTDSTGGVKGGGRRRRRRSNANCIDTTSCHQRKAVESSPRFAADDSKPANSQASTRDSAAAEGLESCLPHLAGTQHRIVAVRNVDSRSLSSNQTDTVQQSTTAPSRGAGSDQHASTPRHHSAHKSVKRAPPESATTIVSRQAGRASRTHPVMRTIRIMQLKKQQHRNQLSSNSTDNHDTTGAPNDHTDNQGNFEDDPQQKDKNLSAKSASAGFSAAKRPALPADEVLVTESSHLNPVYRRIRLQELRLRLQERLRGPQLQRQLLQVQQEQQQLQQANHPHVHDMTAAGSDTLAADSTSSVLEGVSNRTRAVTQGLNSVQRTIRIAQLQQVLQQRYKAGHGSWRFDTGDSRLQQPEETAASVLDGKAVSQKRRQSMVTAGSSVADAQVLLQQLLKAGVPAAQANALAAFGADGIATDRDDPANPSNVDSGSLTVHRLVQLQELLGLSSIAAAAKVVNQQPNLLRRDPATLRHNLQELSQELQLDQQRVQKLLVRYPAALDMSPATVASKAATLAEVLDVPASQAIKVACECPRVLGFSPGTLASKVNELQSSLELSSKGSVVELILGFPAVLGVSSDTLAGKYQRLKGLVQQREDWWRQFLHLRNSRAGTLGRVLAAGPSVLDRLQYLLEASCNNSGNSNDTTCSSGSPHALLDNTAVVAGNDVADSGNGLVLSKSSVKRGGLPGGNFAALLIKSKADFTAMHPEFVLWQLKQRSVAGQQQ